MNDRVVRNNKWWYNRTRANNWFSFRYWWFNWLVFLGGIFLFCWLCPCTEPKDDISCENSNINQHLNDISTVIDSCCNCNYEIPETFEEAVDCPDREIVIQICNSNSHIDDNFEVYLNNVRIGNLILDRNEQIGSLFIASLNSNLEVTEPDFVCPTSNMEKYYFNPGLLNYGENTLELKNIQKNNNGNAGTIELRNYFVSGNSLISPCVVSNQIYSGADGQNFTLNFNYTKCCE